MKTLDIQRKWWQIHADSCFRPRLNIIIWIKQNAVATLKSWHFKYLTQSFPVLSDDKDTWMTVASAAFCLHGERHVSGQEVPVPGDKEKTLPVMQ